MDWQRSCYRSSMRLYRDRPDVLTPGRWYFCPEGAVTTPQSAFFARRFELQDDLDYQLGEVYQPAYRWSDGLWRGPPLNGRHFCGTAESWSQGVLYSERNTLPLNAQGYAKCCDFADLPGRLRLRGWSGYPLGLLLCEDGQFVLQDPHEQGISTKED